VLLPYLSITGDSLRRTWTLGSAQDRPNLNKRAKAISRVRFYNGHALGTPPIAQRKSGS
jgi:hypothetical protein